MTTILHLDNEYLSFLNNIKAKLKQAQIRAALSVNKELIHLYWSLGMELIDKQRKFKWGSNVLEQFSHDMRQTFPEIHGFSVSNIKRMRIFAMEYPDFEIGAQAVHQLPWGHIVVLLHRIKNKSHRNWYAQQIIENGWSRSVLEMQIETDLYSRQAIIASKTTNFDRNLPIEQSQRAIEILKDPYNRDHEVDSRKTTKCFTNYSRN